jgi:hypothetical protein
MAYIRTEQVKSIRDQIKKAYPKYKWSVSRRHHSTVVIILQESDLPFDNVHQDINPYWFKESEKLNTKTKMVVQHVLEICNSVERCYDRNAGDVGADYGDNTYFIDIDIGQWDKPHKIIEALGPRHPNAIVGKVLTITEVDAGWTECKATRIKYGIEPAPLGYVSYLNLSIVEEVI